MKFKMDSDFHTFWALCWADNYRNFSVTNDTLVYRNVRGTVSEAQREFETHLSELMNHRPHQQEF